MLANDEPWEDLRFEVVLDSGTVDHMCDAVDTPGYKLEDSPGKARGQHYVVGDGGWAPNQRQKKLNLEAGGSEGNTGNEINAIFQITKVTRLLMSVSRVCDQGTTATFDEKKAKIRDRHGKLVCVFDRKE